jgi:manganese/zinc/iron transport system substrate-binding protein
VCPRRLTHRPFPIVHGDSGSFCNDLILNSFPFPRNGSARCFPVAIRETEGRPTATAGECGSGFRRRPYRWKRPQNSSLLANHSQLHILVVMTMVSRRSMIRLALAGIAAPALVTRAAAVPATVSVVTTTSMITDLVAVAGGADVTVKGLMGTGVDPHTFRQTRSDIAAMVRADAVVWHGLYLEAQLEDFLGRLAEKRTVVPLAERTIPPDRLIAHPHYTDRYDPHVWMDPSLWRLAAVGAGEVLAGLRPEASDGFLERAVTHAREIDAIGDYAKDVLSTVPAERRVLISAHDAFGYFGRAYGFEVLGIQGLSTESEAGLARIEELVDVLVSRRIPAIFVETSVSDRNVQALVEGAAARGHAVVIGGRLYSDSMGQPGTYEGTYVGMIDHNVTTIARALGGSAPAAGALGRLAMN